MTNAPSVNQMRFFSSSALPKALPLIFAASCSAADTIYRSLDARDAGCVPSVETFRVRVLPRIWFLAFGQKSQRFPVPPKLICPLKCHLLDLAIVWPAAQS